MGILADIALQDFRGYEKLELDFAPGVNVLVGENGQGKSNVLEAIYFLAILRSFRTSTVGHLFRWRQGEFMVRGTVAEAGDRRYSMGVHYSAQRRRLRVDGATMTKASDFIGRLFCVAFVPEDIELVKGAGRDRRRYLDIVLSQLHPGYLGDLQDYQKALKSRNSLLRRDRPDLRAVAAYDTVLATTGAAVGRYRREFFAAFTPVLVEEAARLYPEGRDLTLRFHSSIAVAPDADPAEVHLTALREGRDRDLQRRQTLSGPHRDDFALQLSGRLLASYGSEGQCRLAALALKIATARMIRQAKGQEHTILLVDDVIGELDERGRTAFYRCLDQAAQVFLACTSEDVLTGISPARVFRVVDGSVTAGE